MKFTFTKYNFSIFFHPLNLYKTILCKIKSLYYSRFVDLGGGKIIITDTHLKLKISKSIGSKIILVGDLRIVSNIGSGNGVKILLGENSVLKIMGDFSVGQGVNIVLNDNAELIIGGKECESDSGITADASILVFRRINIGSDFICSWNVFISDSDWHQILGRSHHCDVIIGNHVWVANNCSILKGSNIGDNSIVASHSKVLKNNFPSNSILAGVPAKVISSDIKWDRDLK